ncbi:hypothetical protein CYMTET_7554 [Cymbomonas tetramitiformis]|uniref:Uncharacterized protein n=1 Tax=Cymbomonas tetramitiformis TaxID=36881 RepID=A0AAE0LHD5_9CHLO|nr:hypothetical protein CYMTET_7554 [Cymbomonas tetramitiformis]
MQGESAEPWWARLRRLLVTPVWDATGAPLPAAPGTAPAVLPAGTRCGEHYPEAAETRSARWPALRAAIVSGAKARGLSGTGTTEEERLRFQQEVRSVGAQVPLMSERAHLMAEALKDWPDMAFLVRGAVGFLFAGTEPDEPHVAENYVWEEHEDAMTKELAKELAAGRIFDTRDWLPRGVSALGMVERLRKGKLKYRPVWDYSRPPFVGVNDWIDLQKDEFTSVKDAYSLLRPGRWMVKVDLEEAYRSLPVTVLGQRSASSGAACAEAQEMIDFMIEFVTMLGFKVNRAKCEGPSRLFGIPWRKPESLLGLLAFYAQVVWGLSLYTRQGFALVAATAGRSRVSVSTGVMQDLKVVERVIRLYSGRKVVLHEENVHEDAFATDASLRKGMGGHCAPDYFLVSWEDLAEMPQRDFYPFTSKAKSHITTSSSSRCGGRWRRRVLSGAGVGGGRGARAGVGDARGVPAGAQILVGDDALRGAGAGREGALRVGTHSVGCADLAVERYQDGAYAESTLRSYDTGVKAFLTFCVRFACLGTLELLLPASDATLARFIAFSAWFVQPGTIKSYLAGVRSLHLQQRVEWTPVAHRFWVATALQGVRRTWDRPAKPMMPITLRDLVSMAEFADVETITGAALWEAILVGFYSLFRKDNLTVGKSQAWCWLMLATGDLSEEAPLFQVEGRGKRGALVPMTHAVLAAGLKRLAEQVGLDPARFAKHSLRRGGATAALRLKVDRLYIKLQGDWKSDCYERYCELDDEQRLILPAAFAEAAKELS